MMIYLINKRTLSLSSGDKIKRERIESDDLLCEENMLIIDGECKFALF